MTTDGARAPRLKVSPGTDLGGVLLSLQVYLGSEFCSSIAGPSNWLNSTRHKQRVNPPCGVTKFHYGNPLCYPVLYTAWRCLLSFDAFP